MRTPSDVQLRARGAKRKADLIQRWALPVAWLILIAVFGAIRPTTFLSPQNFSSLLGSQATLVVLTWPSAIISQRQRYDDQRSTLKLDRGLWLGLWFGPSVRTP